MASPRISSIGEYTIDEEKIITTNPYCTVFVARDPSYQPISILRYEGLTSESFEKKHLEKIKRSCEIPHVSILQFKEVLNDRGRLAICHELFEENLRSFIERRRLAEAFLTEAELLWVSRQLVAPLCKPWSSSGYIHGNICLENTLISRNKQKQLVFKFGHVRMDQVAKTRGKQSDIYEVGILIYQLMTLDTKTPNLENIESIQTQLTEKTGPLRTRYPRVSTLLDTVVQMIDSDPKNKPTPNNAAIALAAIDIRDFRNTSSVPTEAIVPAGSGDAIVKTAQTGQAESQYQLALLLNERGHSSQAVAWAQKAASEHNHALAQLFCGRALLTGEGCTKDVIKAEFWLQKAAEQGNPEAFIELGKLVLSRGEYKEAANYFTKGLDKEVDPEVEAEWGLLLASGRGGLDAASSKDEAIKHLKKAALHGNTTAQLALANFPTEEKSRDSWLQKAISRVDQHMARRDLRSLLAATLAFFNREYRLAHPFDIDQLANSVPQELANLIKKCLSADPAQQPKAQELVKALAHEAHKRLPISESKSAADYFYDKAQLLIAKNPKTAFILLEKAAGAGHLVAKEQMAIMLWEGDRVAEDAEDRDKAIRLYVEIAKTKDNFPEYLYQLASGRLTDNPELAVRLLREASLAGHATALQVVSQMLWEGKNVPQDKEEVIRLYVKFAKTKGNFKENLFQLGNERLADNPELAFALLLEAAKRRYIPALQVVSQMLWEGKKVPQNKAEAIRFCELAAKGNEESKKRLEAMRKEYEEEQRIAKEAKQQYPIQSEEPSAPPSSPAEYLRLAFQHFFGLDVVRDLGLSREFLVKASECKHSDPNTQLARAILSLSSNPLDEKCPLRFFVPGDDFQPPFVELETTVYRAEGRAFRCHIVGRIAVLLSPSGQSDIVALLNRCANAHPNVIGPIGITGGVRVVSTTGGRDHLAIGLMYPPAQAALANRDAMINVPGPACSRLLPFLVGIAEGLAHLHRSHVVHGNVSLPYMLVGRDRLGILATCMPTRIRATAPESIASNHFSSASDVFQFGLTIAYMLTGGTPEDAWLPQAGEVDSKTRLARLVASAASGYADIRARIPTWCPSPLVDIMMRCLRQDRTQRPAMEALVTELQNLRSTLANAAPPAAGTRPDQFWLHTPHICGELSVDDAWLRDGGLFECLYGPRMRDRMRQSHNPKTDRCKAIKGQAPGVMHSKSFSTRTGPSSVLAYPNLAPGTRKIIEYKSRFFTQSVLVSGEDGIEAMPRGIRHFPSWARGAMLLDDKRLTAFVDRLDTPPNYHREKVWCNGEPDKCKCERCARPKNPKIISSEITKDVMGVICSFMEMTDYGAFAGTCSYTADFCKGNMLYWKNIIKEFGNQEQIYFNLDIHHEKERKEKEKKQTKQEEKSFDERIRRWAKIIATQQIYMRAYTSLQLKISNVLYMSDSTREECEDFADKAQNEFKAKHHACGLCREPVVFSDLLKDRSTKSVGRPFMACEYDFNHNAWSTPEALTLWGFTMKQLEKIPFWLSGKDKVFCTDDLIEYRKRKPMRKRLKTGKKKINADMWNRYPDLPEFVREWVTVDSPHPQQNLTEKQKRSHPAKFKDTLPSGSCFLFYKSTSANEPRQKDEGVVITSPAPSLRREGSSE